MVDWQEVNALAVKLMKRRKEHKERERGFIYYHGQRVAEGAVELRKRIFPDDPSFDDDLRLAGMFHDVGKGMTPHAKYGKAIVGEALKGLVSDETLEHVVQMIGAHGLRQKEPSPYDIATQLLQDADLLDHSGSYGVWMNAQYYTVFDGCMTDGAKHYLETYQTFVDENYPLLNFELSKAIFTDKIAFETEFAKRAEIEARGHYVLP